MKREIRVTKLNGSLEGGRYLSKAPFRVAISEGSKNVVVEARVPEGALQTVSEPEKAIEKWFAARFAARPLPRANTVIEIPCLD